MLGASLLSTLHVLALAVGLSGVFLRGRALRRVPEQPEAVAAVLRADNAWGVAALLWLATGLLRAFAGFEKGTDYYLHSGAFWVKMGLFAAVLALEVWPMSTFIGWRIRQARHQRLDLSRVGGLQRVNDAEVVLIVAIPFVASAMARGLGFGWFG